MALYKEITEDNGLVLSYHRIDMLGTIINKNIGICVVSYVDNSAREKQKSGDVEHPYVKVVTYNKPYVEDFTIADAYNYLKTLPVFEGAEDI